ncbi:hypothetical protein K435DRAFT_864676 [Dendrothele bispora CBS 962.96]|uniref:Uncharacterized protein n=1 Tax=Dendrothele bispora (strain CBS 962.96) TaxID=1314807 RepID=A0A4S8LL88_DENBC|nr:hypothetical protein K435DRAFT_864676 [Dendrothele bispora CBS 962.96]
MGAPTELIPPSLYSIPEIPTTHELGVPWLSEHLRVPLLDIKRVQNAPCWSPEQLALMNRLEVPMTLQERLAEATEVRDDMRRILGWTGPVIHDPAIDNLSEAEWAREQAARCTRKVQGDGPLPTFTGLEVETRRVAQETVLRETQEELRRVQAEIIETARRRSELKGDAAARDQLLEQMRESNRRRIDLDLQEKEAIAVYEDLVYLNAVALLFLP